MISLFLNMIEYCHVASAGDKRHMKGVPVTLYCTLRGQTLADVGMLLPRPGTTLALGGTLWLRCGTSLAL